MVANYVVGTSGVNSRFNDPVGVAVISYGRLAVSNYVSHSIAIIDILTGYTTHLAGSTSGVSGYADGVGTAAQFGAPACLAYHAAAGALYVAENEASRIRKVMEVDGATTAVAGSTSGAVGSTDGIGSAALFRNPRSVALIAATQTLLVADTNNHLMRLVRVGSGNTATHTVVGAALVPGEVDGVGTNARLTTPGSSPSIRTASSLSSSRLPVCAAWSCAITSS
jgi:hypothetical protein